MLEFTIRIFQRTDTARELRLLQGDNPVPLRTRPLVAGEIDSLVEHVEVVYRPELVSVLSPLTLVDLGKMLARWLDGPADRWLDFILSQRKPTTLHMDVEGKLRHLPWELLYQDGFLCERATGALNVVRQASSRTGPAGKQNRPLRVLFMASSPEGQATLDFEEEEAKILKATLSQPIELVVEESGTLDQLTNRIASDEAGYFDVLHLTGHADVKDGTPVFLAEDAFGQPVFATAEQLAAAIGERWPRLICLSGCSTGQAPERGQLPSLCEDLVNLGAPSVLGWALPVGDTTSAIAAAKLYALLATGEDLHSAFALTRKELLKRKSLFWHLLRAYADASPLLAPVTSLNTPRRQRRQGRPMHADFLDHNGKMRVCSREDFVGRRRPLQRCLRRLQPSESEVQGVLLHGLGGIGKSSLAARLSERLPRLHRVVLVGNVDEAALIGALCDEFPQATDCLQGPNVRGWSLLARLRGLLQEQTIPPILLILDDFEHTFDASNLSAGPNAAARGVLEAFLQATCKTGSESRVLVTCRYTFDLRAPLALHAESLEGLRHAEQTKKIARLDALERPISTGKLPESVRERALHAGARNPRLMERLWALLGAAPSETEALLGQLEATAEKFREEILLAKLLEQARPSCRDLLARAAVYEVAVERGALVAVAPAMTEEDLEQAESLGLLEAGAEPAGAGAPARYQVPDLLRPMLQGKLDEAAQKEVTRAAVRYLYRAWWENQTNTKLAQIAEIHRLALKAKDRTIAAEVVVRLAQTWMAGGLYREAKSLCEETLKVAENHHSTLYLLARTEHHLGDTGEALKHFQQALDACPSDDSALQVRAAAMHAVAFARWRLGEVEEAMVLWQQSLGLSERAGDILGKAATLRQMAVVRAQQDRVEAAMVLWQQSLDLCEQAGDVKDKAATLHEMAVARAQQGKDEAAMGLWQRSLDLNKSIGNVEGKAATLHEMAGVHLRRGEVEEAMVLWQQSLDIHERIGNAQGKAATLHNMAVARAHQGKDEEAAKLLQQSLDISERIGDAKGKAATLRLMRQGKWRKTFGRWLGAVVSWRSR